MIETMQRRWLLPLLLPLLAVLTGCSGEGDRAEAPLPPSSYIEKGDLDAVAKRGRLRVLMIARPSGTSFLPRSGSMDGGELELLHRFAEEQSLAVEVVPVDRYEALIPQLLEGRGDIIADNFTITADRRKQVAFSAPIAFVREQVVKRPDDSVAKPHDLDGRRIAVHPSDAYILTLKRLQNRRFQPPFTIEEVDEAIATEAILDGVARGSYDLAVADSNLVSSLLSYRNDIAVAFDLSGIRSIGWAVRPNAQQFKERLNDFIHRHHLGERDNAPHSDDLKGIKKRGVLRMLTRNNAANYFLWRGELLGFEFEMMKRFANAQGLRLEVIVPPAQENLIEWLKQGRGDVIAASMTATDARRGLGIAFTRPYNTVSEVVVARSGAESPPRNKEELAGRRVAVRAASSYAETLRTLRQQGVDVAIEEVAPTLETEEIIARVARGDHELTIADNHILDIELTWRDDIEAAFSFEKERPLGWGVRRNNPDLLKALDGFIDKEYRGLFYNVTFDKYFRNSRTIKRHAKERIDRDGSGRFSRYDDLARQNAKQFGFDWRLIVAQMYQESRFDPKAKSWMGAQGLMQVLPKTAKALKIKGDLKEPKVGVYAGVKYLNWLMQRFETRLDPGERTWFALAAYNAGIGHVRDARRLARQKGWNGDEWFGNVEKAMLLLSKKEYASKAKHGYAHGRETLAYVRDIRNRYRAYLDLTD